MKVTLGECDIIDLDELSERVEIMGRPFANFGCEVAGCAQLAAQRLGAGVGQRSEHLCDEHAEARLQAAFEGMLG